MAAHAADGRSIVPHGADVPVRIYGLSPDGLGHQGGNVLRAAPSDGGARSAVSVVVNDRNPHHVLVQFHPNRRPSRPQPHDALNDLGVGKPGGDVGAPFEIAVTSAASGWVFQSPSSS